MVAEYYEAVAHRLLPHVAKRPLSLFRSPKGIESDGFFQKHLGSSPINHLRDASMADECNDSYIALQDIEGLITTVQWNVLELHLWGYRLDNIEKPDRMVFDLDPGPKTPWALTLKGARGLRFLLEELGFSCFLKTSGGKGLHILVPLQRRHTWDEVKGFACAVARKIAKTAPRHFTSR